MTIELHTSAPVVCPCGCKAPRLISGNPEGLEERAARGLAAQGWAGGKCPECNGCEPDTRPIEQRAAEHLARFRRGAP
jgi:hypothetical protein